MSFHVDDRNAAHFGAIAPSQSAENAGATAEGIALQAV